MRNYKATSGYVAKIAELCPNGVMPILIIQVAHKQIRCFLTLIWGTESQSVVKSLNIILKGQRLVRVYYHPYR